MSLGKNAMRKSSTLAASHFLALALTFAAALATQPASRAAPARFTPEPLGAGAVKVGPPNGTVIAVGGGAQGPRIWKAFIAAAGGPDALILDVPNNSVSKPESVAPKWAGEGFRKHGARNVHVLFTQSREVANSDAFVAIIQKARGIWFDGGRQYRDIEAYAGTKTERAFWGVLERGGVIGGSSAGMAVLGDFLVRGAPSNNNYIEDYPGFEKGFGFLRDTATDMHVVARERLPDLTSVLAWYPNVLGISADEGTAWIVHGDVGRIIGRGKAFVYNSHGPTDPGVPYLTLYPGDSYNLYTRQVVGRAADKSPVTKPFVTSLFRKYDARRLGGATVLVAENGEVFVDRAFGVPPQNRYMPRTTLPQFPIGDITGVFTSLCAQLPARASSARGGMRPAFYSSSLEKCVARLSMPVGMHRTTAPPGDHEILSDVDELYRFELGLEYPSTWPKADYAKGWTVDTFDGVERIAAYGTRDGQRAAFVRIPSRRATVIILTNDRHADARAMSERILSKLLAASR
jgi:cyanophycinase